jgi:DNA-binding MarR family transcriptional regulator
MKMRSIFIEEVENLLDKYDEELSEKAIEYFEKIKEEESKKLELSKKGILVIEYMQSDNAAYNNRFTAKLIGDNLFENGRTASGILRKLVSEGLVEKVGDSSPVVYALTEEGKEIDLKNL